MGNSLQDRSRNTKRYQLLFTSIFFFSNTKNYKPFEGHTNFSQYFDKEIYHSLSIYSMNFQILHTCVAHFQKPLKIFPTVNFGIEKGTWK